MTTCEDVSGGGTFEAAHWPQSLLQVTMIVFDPIIEIPRATMLYVWQDRAEGRWVARGFIRRHALWAHPRLGHGPLEEGLRCLGIPPSREIGINHLPILINRTVNVRPLAGESGVGFVDPPRCANGSSVNAGGVLEPGQEALDPPINRAPIDDQPSLREPLC